MPPAVKRRLPRSPVIDYEAKPLAPRGWGRRRIVWLLLAGFCALAEFAGAFATNGINGWGDVAFIVVFAVIGVVALVHARWPLPRDA
jgi:hypothetical protein